MITILSTADTNCGVFDPGFDNTQLMGFLTLSSIITLFRSCAARLVALPVSTGLAPWGARGRGIGSLPLAGPEKDEPAYRLLCPHLGNGYLPRPDGGIVMACASACVPIREDDYDGD
jgi:hypothetical protein